VIDADAIDARAAAHDKIGWSRLGYELREITWDARELDAVGGRTIVVTGATDGLGRATAERLAVLGARVVLVARNPDKLATVADEIRTRTGNDRVGVVTCDLSALASVRLAAAELLDRYPAIHVLINNAGVLLPERTTTVDGFETTWATNILGPYLLTELLLDRVVASAPSRIVEVSSGGMYSERIDVDDSQTEHREYVGTAVYARTKRAQVIVTEERAKRLAGTGVVCHSLHPGWAATPGVFTSLASFAAKFGDILRTPMQGADTTVWLAAAERPARDSGLFWQDRRPRETYRDDATRETPEQRARLLALLHEQAGLPG
jgi:NAD(P)-dependent dehydrogenase (short-subunit alcohol dehydrogenase family)